MKRILLVGITILLASCKQSTKPADYKDELVCYNPEISFKDVEVSYDEGTFIIKTIKGKTYRVVGATCIAYYGGRD